MRRACPAPRSVHRPDNFTRRLVRIELSADVTVAHNIVVNNVIVNVNLVVAGAQSLHRKQGCFLWSCIATTSRDMLEMSIKRQAPSMSCVRPRLNED